MAVPYIDLFNLAYSTSISESVKEEIINHTGLPILESAIEISEDIYESIYFLDELAYSDMSEGAVNDIIDSVFEGCCEEYLEQVYEAYVRTKALIYISEGTAPIGLRALEREAAKRDKTPQESTLKNVVGYTAHRAKEGIKSAVGSATQKAKEGIKNAVGKVKNWWNDYKQKANDWAANKAATQNVENKEVAPKAEAPQDSDKYSSLSQVLKGKMPKSSDKYKDYEDTKAAEQLMKSYDDSIKKNKLPKKSEIQNSPDQVASTTSSKVQGAGKPKTSKETVNADNEGSNQVITGIKKQVKNRTSKKTTGKGKSSAKTSVKKKVETPKIDTSETSKPSVEALDKEEGKTSKKEEKIEALQAPTEEKTEEVTPKEDTSSKKSASEVASSVVQARANRQAKNKELSNSSSEVSSSSDEVSKKKSFKSPEGYSNLKVSGDYSKNSIQGRLQDIKDKRTVKSKDEEKRILNGGTTRDNKGEDNFYKLLKYTKETMLKKAKTPEERQKILADYKDTKSYHNSPEAKAHHEKVNKNFKKNGSKIKALNKQEKDLEDKLKRKDVSDSDKLKYQAEIEKINKQRHKLVEG